jgi:propionyl-CoA carboxylase alpha chain/3-methylcrotonyl-CoA carboxylase alpha subunit
MTRTFIDNGEPFQVRFIDSGNFDALVVVDENSNDVRIRHRSIRHDTRARVSVGDKAYPFFHRETVAIVFDRGNAHQINWPSFSGGDGHSAASDGALRAPMPGKIVATPAKPGDTVTKGQPIVVLEAMKMEHALVAPFDGVVGEIGVAVGDQVADGTVLAVVTAAEK